VAFARALYRDAPILLLDEATASVDSTTEGRLHAGLVELMKGRTALIIAHRLSTIRSADRIVVLHRGAVVEQGTHEALVAEGGLYAKLHALQVARG
jgi:ATP-binding cassette subfamily B protein